MSFCFFRVLNFPLTVSTRIFLTCSTCGEKYLPGRYLQLEHSYVSLPRRVEANSINFVKHVLQTYTERHRASAHAHQHARLRPSDVCLPLGTLIRDGTGGQFPVSRGASQWAVWWTLSGIAHTNTPTGKHFEIQMLSSWVRCSFNTLLFRELLDQSINHLISLRVTLYSWTGLRIASASLGGRVYQ